MRLKFRQDGIDVVIAVTNVHYCKHQTAVYGYNPNDETDEFGNIYKCGLAVSQQDVPQNVGMLFVGISKMGNRERPLRLQQLMRISPSRRRKLRSRRKRLQSVRNHSMLK